MKSKLSIIHINIRSIISTEKKISINNLITKYDPDFISINETFLKPNHSFHIDGYKIYRIDRLYKRGGGTALGVRSTIEGKKIDFSNITKNEYAIGFQLKTSQTVIISLYILTSNETLNSSLFECMAKYKKLIITGDLNA